MPLILDIETVPLASSLTVPFDRSSVTPPANYKTSEAIKSYIDKAELEYPARRVKECSLNPRLGRVLCIGMATDVPNLWPVAMAATEEDEADVLRTFWKHVALHDGRVVTWNGSWDLRFLVVRSLSHGIVPTVSGDIVSKWFKKYTTEPHFDCKAVLLDWDVRQIGEGLSQWAAFFGVAGKLDGLSGADVYPLYEGGQLDEIAQYCAADVAATQAIYERIAPVFGASLPTF